MWLNKRGRYTVYQNNIALAINSDHNFGANGAVVFTTALPVALTEGCYMYFLINDISGANAAGWYWTVFSNTTTATVYNNTYDPPAGVPPAIPASPTAFVCGDPGGAINGDTTARVCRTVNIPGGVMGINGCMVFNRQVMVNNTAGNKISNLLIGAVSLLSRTLTTTNWDSADIHMVNCGGVALNRNWLCVEGSTTSAGTTTTIDTGAAMVFTHSIQQAVKSDWCIDMGIKIELIPEGGAF